VRTLRLTVELRGVEPRVSRIIDVPATATLPELHRLLQAALGWTDSHLHQFDAGDTLYQPDPDGFADLGGPRVTDEQDVGLRDLPRRFAYVYDLGDTWEHDVEVVGPGGDGPGCPAGEGACPPEDCGGPGGYDSLLAALAEPDRPEHAELIGWAGELRPFDLARTDLLVRQIAGSVPEAVRQVLDLAADGVPLTPGGRLPQKFVRAVQDVRPDWSFDGRPATREDNLIPLLALHDVLREVKLLRVAKGVLRPTRAAGDDTEVVRRLRSWFGPDDGFPAILASVTVGVLASRSPLLQAELAREVAAMLGPQWVRGGERLDEQGVVLEIAGLSPVLRALDLVDTADRRRWSAGPSARWLLPRATLFAHFRGDPVDAGETHP
jgi:hypothetical protein